MNDDIWRLGGGGRAVRARAWFLFAVLAAASISAAPAAARHGGIHIPEPRVGDQVLYASTDPALASFAFEWLPAERTEDPWGRPVDVSVLAFLVPATELDPEAPGGAWVPFREAFAGVASDPLWRQRDEAATWRQGNEWVTLPGAIIGFPALRNITESVNLTWSRFGPTPLFRSCLAHHGLQAHSLSTAAVPLTALCPALDRRDILAEPKPARGATFLGRPSVELVYALGATDRATADLALPINGTLRIVLADGLPYVAEVEARDAKGVSVWRYALSGLQGGTGPTVPPWLLGAPTAAAPPPAEGTYASLEADGPADGGTSLPYRLDEAISSLRGDLAMRGLRAWETDHPGAFVLKAELWLDAADMGGSIALWVVRLGAARDDGTFDTIRVASRLVYSENVPRVGGLTPGLVTNYDGTNFADEVDAVAPGSRAALDFASALRLAGRHVTYPFTLADVSYLAYEAPAAGRGPLLSVRSQNPATSGTQAERTTVILDASAEAATDVLQHHYRTVYGSLEPHYPDLGAPVETLAADPDLRRPLPVLSAAMGHVEVVGATILTLLVALLAHGGYLTVAYSRLRRSDLLDHPLRRRIFDLIRERPGIHMKGIAAAAGIAPGTALYHLRVLERGALVTPVPLANYRRYYATGTLPHGALRSLAELESPRARSIYEIVRREPGLSISDLARRTSVSRVAAHKTVGRLADAGLVQKETRPGHAARIVARDPGRLN